MDDVKLWQGAAEGLLISMDFGDAERQVLSQWAVQGTKVITLDSLNEEIIGKVLTGRRRSAILDAAATQELMEEDKVEAWGDSPWEKRIPRNRSGNRTPKLQAKTKNRQKAKQAKAARKHNR